MKRDAHAGEYGQVVAIFAGSLLVLLIVVGLVIDAGFAFAGRRDAQNTADLASMAGTRALAEYYIGAQPATQIHEEVRTIADQNGCANADPCLWEAYFVDQGRHRLGGLITPSSNVPANALGVEVGVIQSSPTVIVGPVMAMLGQDPIRAWGIHTTAISLTGGTSTFAGQGQLLPIALREPEDEVTGDPEPFREGEVYTITDAQLDAPGSFGWLSWTGANDARTLETSVCTPDNPTFTLPTWIQNSPGAKNSGGTSGGGIRGCLEYYLANDIPVLVPVYGRGCTGSDEAIQGTGSRTDYCIVAVVEMQLTALNYAPVVKEIKALFRKVFAYNPGTIPAGTTIIPPSAEDSSYFLGLVE